MRCVRNAEIRSPTLLERDGRETKTVVGVNIITGNEGFNNIHLLAIRNPLVANV